MDAYSTIEEAQARIVELQDELAVVKTERDSLSQDKEKLTGELDQARALNQKFFNRLAVQDEQGEDDEDGEEVPTCEEYALTLNII